MECFFLLYVTRRTRRTRSDTSHIGSHTLTIFYCFFIFYFFAFRNFNQEKKNTLPWNKIFFSNTKKRKINKINNGSEFMKCNVDCITLVVDVVVVDIKLPINA